MLLPHKKELIGFLPLSDLYTDYKSHHRLRVFAKKGRECVSCGRVGTLLALGRDLRAENWDYHTEKWVGKVHVDLYTDDFVLMTVDHITPKYVAKREGWRKQEIESINNKQPMCEPCNSAKGHKVFTPEQEAIYRRQMRNNTPKQHKNSQALISIVPNIHVLLGNNV